jgi:hypothetical protein
MEHTLLIASERSPVSGYGVVPEHAYDLHPSLELDSKRRCTLRWSLTLSGSAPFAGA